MKKRWLVIITVLAVLVGGACGDDDDSEAGSGSADKSTKAEKISVTGDEYSFGVDKEVKGGFVEVEFKNEGAKVHEAAFVRVDPKRPQADVIKAVKAAASEEGAPIEPFIHIYLPGNVSEVKGGETKTAEVSLPSGSYYLLCALTDDDSLTDEEQEAKPEDAPELPTHMEQGMIAELTVTGAEEVTLPDDAEATVVATEYAFDVKGLKAGKQDVLFRNDGKEIHMAAIMEFPAGVNEAAAAEVLKAFAGPPGQGPPPGPEPEEAGFTGIFEPGGGNLFELEAKAGRVYAFLCFIQDRAGGPPHIAKGMSKLLTVA